MSEPNKKFVIFAHGATYDKLHQVGTLALTAAALGRDVHVILMFWAIKKLAMGKLDEVESESEKKGTLVPLQVPVTVVERSETESTISTISPCVARKTVGATPTPSANNGEAAHNPEAPTTTATCRMFKTVRPAKPH